MQVRILLANDKFVVVVVTIEFKETLKCVKPPPSLNRLCGFSVMVDGF